jgi:plasmid stabilization system protein ParE
MSRTLIIRPEAQDELAAAERWYEQQRPGTGAAFVQAVDAVIARILSVPELYSVVHDDVRCALLRRFPYGVYYRVTDTH